MVKTIEIEEAVYSALEERVQGFGEKPNDVIKRLLAGVGNQKANTNGTGTIEKPSAAKSNLIKFVESPEYLRGKARARYFDILRFIHKENPLKFEKLQGFQKGSRIQISKAKGEILQSGRHTYPQLLDGTPFWVVTNLSTERKQALLEDILRFLGYSEETIDPVVKSIPAHFPRSPINPTS